MTRKDAPRRPGAKIKTTVGQQQGEVSIDEEAGGGIYGEYDPLRGGGTGEYGIVRPDTLGEERRKQGERREARMRVLRRRRLACLTGLLLLAAVVAAVLLEEWQYGVGFLWYMNHYSAVVHRPLTVARADDAPSIAIVVVLKDATHDDQYALASSTLHCYAAAHGYPLRVVIAAANASWAAACPQPDFMFHRHCVLRHLLDEMDEEWALFLDADIGVVNPNHLIEEYLPPGPDTHVVFYDRIMNHEVMAGSYLVRNSEFSRRFLKHWADAYFSLPNSFHGTDNGAIHNVLLEFALPALHEERAKCEELWREARDFDSLDTYEVCTRALMAGKKLEGIEIRNATDARRWSRDGWLTDSTWSPRDFMLHGWQTKRLDVLGFARWHSPLARAPGGAAGATDADVAAACADRAHAARAWAYKDSFVAGDEEIARAIGAESARQAQSYAEKLAMIK